jgi:hypothetical protein
MRAMSAGHGLAACAIGLLTVVGLTSGCTGGVGGSGGGCPSGTANPAATVSYSRDIVPILQNAGCMALGCHGGFASASGYDVTTYRGVFGAGTEAQSLGVCDVVPGDANRSYLMEKLRGNPRQGVQMPQGRAPLSSSELTMFQTWITEGAANN